jgi:hypothetical protein
MARDALVARLVAEGSRSKIVKYTSATCRVQLETMINQGPSHQDTFDGSSTMTVAKT